MITLQKRLPRIVELWFDQKLPTAAHADVAYLRQWNFLPVGLSANDPNTKNFSTRVIDLNQDTDCLKKNLDSGTAYEIRRAHSKDDLVCELLLEPTPQDLERFVTFYNAFAQSKGLQLAPLDQMQARFRAGALHLSVASHKGEVVVWHCYIGAAHRARLLYSASSFRDSEDTAYRAMVGRANRALHWFDILEYKKLQCAWYDFGGWYTGTNDEQLLGINRFKQSFGGTVVVEYNAVIAISLLGRLKFRLAKWRSN